MLASWDKLDDESKKKFLKIIVEQSNRLINLVENMLSVTKLQGAKENLIYKEVSIKPVVEMIASIVKNQYKDKSFKIDINSKVPNILVDKDKFQQIMTNLMENAAKYGDEGSVIEVRAAYVPENVCIEVINSGIEIPKEDYEKIFTKFSRIDNPLTRKVQGSWLVLYITKSLVEKMGGKIFVTSGNGITKFSVSMPAGNIERQAREKCKQ